MARLEVTWRKVRKCGMLREGRKNYRLERGYIQAQYEYVVGCAVRPLSGFCGGFCGVFFRWAAVYLGDSYRAIRPYTSQFSVICYHTNT